MCELHKNLSIRDVAVMRLPLILIQLFSYGLSVNSLPETALQIQGMHSSDTCIKFYFSGQKLLLSSHEPLSRSYRHYNPHALAPADAAETN